MTVAEMQQTLARRQCERERDKARRLQKQAAKNPA